MTGLELCRAYFEEVGRPAFDRQEPDILKRAAAGLVGDGSDCFGFDDETSRDHDWGPGFCVWLNDADYRVYGGEAWAVYQRLPQEFCGFARQNESAMTAGRVGILPIGAFYMKFLGLPRAPETLEDWRRIPEDGLAAATNGAVFQDPTGEFSAIRNALLDFYPEDLRKKRLACQAALAAQSGQYNYSRCLQHGEPVAAHLALAKYIEHVQSIVFLLNRKYKPFYKWAQHAMEELPILGEEVAPLLLKLTLEILSNNSNSQADDKAVSVAENGSRQSSSALDSQVLKKQLVEEIAGFIIEEFHAQGLSSSDSDFLMDHAWCIRDTIENPDLRAEHIMIP